MNRTTHYSEEISQTALALLALVAAGKSLDAATVRSLRSLLTSQYDSCDNRVNLTIFSDNDDEYGKAEPPVIIPFAERSINVNRYHNGYGTLSLRNRPSPSANSGSWPRIFSPEGTDCPDDEDALCMVASAPALKKYAE